MGCRSAVSECVRKYPIFQDSAIQPLIQSISSSDAGALFIYCRAYEGALFEESLVALLVGDRDTSLSCKHTYIFVVLSCPLISLTLNSWKLH